MPVLLLAQCSSCLTACVCRNQLILTRCYIIIQDFTGLAARLSARARQRAVTM